MAHQRIPQRVLIPCGPVSGSSSPGGGGSSDGDSCEQPQGQFGKDSSKPSKRHVYVPTAQPPQPQAPSQLNRGTVNGGGGGSRQEL